MNVYNVKIFLIFVTLIFEVHSVSKIPEVTFEALESGGFRAYIPDSNNVTFFALNANVNKGIGSNQPGQLNNETRIIVDNYLSLNFNERLRIGDVLNYWIFVTADRGGYRKEGLTWEVTELLDSYTNVNDHGCIKSITTTNGNNVCKGDLIFEDEFDQFRVDISKWVIEQRIPTYVGPNFEFNSYQDSNSTCFIQNGVLHLKPIAIMDENEVRGELNLRNGCTSSNDNECYYRYASAFLLPPVKSAKIISKNSTKYGRFEIRAQLPAGDWIFPIIQLESKDGGTQNESSVKAIIAYSRGNNFLRSIDVRNMNSNDIGSRQLTAGPVVEFTEPGRTEYTVTSMNTVPLSNEFHNYSLLWLPGRMWFYVDSVQYGTVSLLQNRTNYNVDRNQHSTTLESLFDQEFELSLGVAVGGLNDFPDGYNSEMDVKPWRNDERNYIKNFFDARNSWTNTWINNKPALKIDYVKIWAV